jgi:hypothetical protein
MDEVFEALTLIQTGKASIYPIVLLDAKGGKYWKFWKQFISEQLARRGMISKNDFALFLVTDEVEEAVREVAGFYRVFHSYRYVGDKIILRLLSELTAEAVARLNEEFADIVKSGKIVQQEALEEESDEPELGGLRRLVFRHWRRDFGRLRQLIDAVNGAERAPETAAVG